MESFKNQRVLIFGLGLNQGGSGAARFFAKMGAQVRVIDLRGAKILKPALDELKEFPNIQFRFGEHQKKDFDWADLIIKNPAVKPGNQFIQYAKDQGKRIETDMGIFLSYVNPRQILGITGTKGKSTTASLIYEVLKNNGKKVILAGNIGTSVLDTTTFIKPDVTVVLEISSFQLESFDQHRVSPKYAIVTNIYPDHLNYYPNMDKYFAAKKLIGKYQTPDDFLFINKDDPTVAGSKFLSGMKAKVIFYSVSDLPQGFDSVLKGKHNQSNMAAALAFSKIFGLDKSTIFKTLKTFKGIAFRMEKIASWQGIDIINDTTATGPEAAIQSITTFPHCILICGGMNKGMAYKEFAKTIDKYVKKVFFLKGDATEEMKKLITGKEKIMGTYDSLEKLLSEVKKSVVGKDIILFSPAATSFNLFQNEFDRGRKFNQAVKKVFHD